MRQLIMFIFFVSIISGCRDKIICPAFQSTYILDDSVRSIYYSYLWKLNKEERLKYIAGKRADPTDTSLTASLPAPNAVDYYAYVEPYIVQPNEVKKSKYGIVKYEPYWLKNYQLRTAPMENVLAPKPAAMPDTAAIDIGEFVASDFADTVDVVGDTLSVAANEMDTVDTFEYPTLVQAPPPKPKKETVFLYNYDPKDEMLNVEQQYYNKHFGHLLYRTREVPVEQPQEVNASADSTQARGGLMGLFKRKKGNDEPLVEPASEPVNDEEIIEEEMVDDETVDDGF